MAYEIVINEKNRELEIHWDLCDKLMEIKDNYALNNENEYINLIDFDEVEEFINKEEYKDYKVVFCIDCNPKENRKKYDEEYDDFYEEFDEDEEVDNSRCDIF